MKKLILVMLSCAFLAPVFAQDDAGTDDTGKPKKEKKEKKESKFGNFLRRVGESTTGINMSNETFVAVDIRAKQLADFSIQSCVGDPSTGSVILTIAVTAKSNGCRCDLGQYSGEKAYDSKGNEYKGKEAGDGYPKNLVAGVPVQYQFVFTSVPTSLAQLEVVMLEFYIQNSNDYVGSNMSDVEPMQVRNIPIAWGIME